MNLILNYFKLKRLGWVCFVLFYSVQLFGQKLGFSSLEYGVEDGIPSTEVYSVIEDKDGFLWFGTDAGVAKFDGYAFKLYTTIDGLTDNVVFKLYEDYKGRIWFMPFNGRLCFIEEGIIHEYEFNYKIKKILDEDNWGNELFIDTNDKLTISFRYGGYAELTKDGQITYQLQGNKEYSEIHIDNHSENVLAYKLRSLNPLKNRQLVISDEKWGKSVLVGKTSRKEYGMGALLLEDSYPGVYFYFGDTLYQYHNGKILSKLDLGYSIICVSEDIRGQAWVCSRENGVNVYCNMKAFFQDEKPITHIFAGGNVAKILAKDNGEMWFCLENGGVRYIPNEFIQNYTFGENKKENKIVSFYKDNLDQVFYTSELGKTYVIDTTGEHHFYYDFKSEMTQLLISNDTLYGSINGQPWGVSKMLPNGIKKVDIFKGRGVVNTDENSLWKIHHSTVIKVLNGKVVYDYQKEHGHSYFRTVFQDANSNIWVGGNKGLFLFEADSLRNVNHWLETNEGVKVIDIDQLSDGRLVIATGGSGAILLGNPKDDKRRTITNIGLKGFVIRDVWVDEEDEIWFGTSSGLIHYRLDDNGKLIIQRITNKNGLPTNEINEILTVGSLVYVGTNKGLSVFNKKNVSKNPTPPWLYIQEVKVNEKEVPIASRYDLSHTDNSVEFSYVGLSFRSLGKVHYRYRLEGIEKDWQYTKARKIRYPSLASGNYRFMVSAANEDEVWSEEIIIPLMVQTAFWKTWWFIQIIIILIILSLIIGFKERDKRNYQNQIKEQKIEKQKRLIIETELKMLRAQMNPHFTFNALNSIQNSVTNFDQEKAITYISRFSLLLRKILENSKYTFITVKEELEMLNLYVTLENLRFDETINCDFVMDEKIDQEFQQIPSMIIQPFIENSINHGLSGLKDREKKILVKMVQKEKHIHCVVEDNGIGRERSAEIKKMKRMNHQSMGMEITRDRLALFFKDGGDKLSFKVTDLYNEKKEAIGTRVDIFFAIRYEN